MQSYEIEMTSLLGTPEKADELRKALVKIDPLCKIEIQSKRLEHNFQGLPGQGGTLASLAKAIAPHISGVGEIKLDDLVERAESFSILTHEKEGLVSILIEATVANEALAGGPSAIKIEEKVPLSLEEIDKLILSAGFSYKTKWLQEREQYFCSGIDVTIDKNAGYGWMAQFERIVDDPTKVDVARSEIRALMGNLGLEELPEGKLERILSFYGSNWQDYYGTDKTFKID